MIILAFSIPFCDENREKNLTGKMEKKKEVGKENEFGGDGSALTRTGQPPLSHAAPVSRSTVPQGCFLALH